jgi:hypothetical protein
MKILKGMHVSIDQFTGIWCGAPVEKNFIFTESCRYDIGEDQKDWNKLFGMSFGFTPLVKQFQMHENSARFGWRYDIQSDMIEVAPYLYTNGKREYAETLNLGTFFCEIGKEYNMFITAYATYVLYTVDSKHWVLEQNIPAHRGFTAPIYFGGNKPAPHTIEILQ